MLQFKFSFSNINDAALRLLQWADGERIFAFYGEMGSGKTTLIAAIGKHLGITDQVTSPTFAIINEYALPVNKDRSVVLHMDWYRLKDEEEAITTGVDEALNRQDALVFVEWPERAPSLLQVDHIAIRLAMFSETERSIEVSRHFAKGENI